MALSFAAVLLGLSLPERAPRLPQARAGEPFRWDGTGLFATLEADFHAARRAAAAERRARFAALTADGETALAALPEARDSAALAAMLERLSAIEYRLAALAATQRDALPSLADLVARTRTAALAAAFALPTLDPAVPPDEETAVSGERLHRALYRAVYGTRRALEEALLQGDAKDLPDRLHFPGAPPCSGPAAVVAGETICSGDILLSRGGAVTSALIARGNDFPGDFSHVALVHAGEGQPVAVESLIEHGAVVTPAENYLADHKRRILVLRLRPGVAVPPLAAHRAAAAIRARAGESVPYDFAMDFADDRAWFCSEVAYHAYAPLGVDLWARRTTMSAPGVVSWLAGMGVTNFTTIAPADLELDPRLAPVLEWRDAAALRANRTSEAMLDALLEGADAGDRLGYRSFELPTARAAIAYSGVARALGAQGAIPRGLSAGAALRVRALQERIGPLLAADIEAAAERFEREQGYWPPYWRLVDLARGALAARRSDLAPYLSRP